MLSDSVVTVLQLSHASFNAALLVAFAIQGGLGLRIRRKRFAGAPQDFTVVKRHRKRGPVLAALLPLGYVAGLGTTYLSRGVWVRHPGHFAAGTVLLVIVGTTFLASRRIRGLQSPWRNVHAALGLLLLCAFVVQVVLGLGVLF